ncbi:MAG TPA: hypothetical protein VH598_03935 [Verrucomicrobiae bacterium]|jgi:hypothetical protein|nr:hypothetical protein [Verrucomicrobiae bacterium]
MKSFRAVSSPQTLEGASEWSAVWSAADEHRPAAAATQLRKEPFPSRLKQVFQGALGFSMVLPIALIVVFLPALLRVANCFKPRK